MNSTLLKDDHDNTAMNRLKRVKDLMLPLDEFGIVDQNATMLDALRVYRDLQELIPASHNPQHAVLVRDHQGRIVGKLGQFAISGALIKEDNNLLQSCNNEVVDTNIYGDSTSISNRLYINLIHENIDLLCMHMRKIKVKDIMIPETASIDMDATLYDALVVFVNSRSLSLLVSFSGEVIGLLLLADLVEELSEYILQSV
ncbi:MAG: CBS domain-containing protein [Candidatus Electryonea clarkiae]|nr:CBS domain-containing protein [Candidatus Electryonea clarkiae]